MESERAVSHLTLKLQHFTFQAEKEHVPEERKHPSKPLGSPAKNLRFFGDTDAESDAARPPGGPAAPRRAAPPALRPTASPAAAAAADEPDLALAPGAKSRSLTSLRGDSPRARPGYKRNLHNISEIQSNSEVDSQVRISSRQSLCRVWRRVVANIFSLIEPHTRASRSIKYL